MYNLNEVNLHLLNDKIMNTYGRSVLFFRYMIIQRVTAGTATSSSTASSIGTTTVLIRANKVVHVNCIPGNIGRNLWPRAQHAYVIIRHLHVPKLVNEKGYNHQ